MAMAQTPADARQLAAARTTGYTMRDLAVLGFYGWRAITFGFLLIVAIGVVAALNARTQYRAEGRLLVMVSREHVDNQGIGAQLPTVVSVDGLKAVESEINILVSPAVIKQMVDAIGPQILFPELAQRRYLGFLPAYPEESWPGRAVEMVQSRLRAEPASDSNIVRLTFNHPVPEIAAKAVNELFEAYLIQRRQIYDRPRLPFLSGELARFADQLRRVETEIQGVKSHYGVIDIRQEVLLSVNQIDSIVARRRQTQERREGLKSEVAETAAKLAKTPPTVFDFSETTNQSQNDDDRNVLLRLQLQRDKLLQHYQPDYPPLKDVERQIEVVRRSLRSQDKPQFSSRREVRNPALAFLTNHLTQLEIEASAIQRQLDELERQQKDAEQRVAVLRDAEARLNDLERTRGIVEQIHKDYAMRTEAARIDESQARTDDASVRVTQWAVEPVVGETMVPSFLVAGILGGLLFGAAVGVAAAWIRQVFILPGEAERGLALPALASLSDASTRQVREEMMLLAARLAEFSVDGRPMKRLQVLADSEAADTVSTVRSLAIELAQGHGRNVVVVDLIGDGRGVLSELGAASGGGASRHDDGVEIVVTDVEGLSVAVGSVDTVLASLRTSLPRIRAFLNRRNEEADIVLIAAPPMRQSHLGQRLAVLVDASILVVRAEQTRALAAINLRDAILEAGGDLLGMIFTGRRFHVPKAIYRWI